MTYFNAQSHGPSVGSKGPGLSELLRQQAPDAVTNERGATFAEEVEALYAFAQDVLLKKHKDYGPKNISDSPGGPLNGLRVRMHDKMARINHLIESGAEPENESLKDSFLDLGNYCMIAMLVLNGDWPE